MIFVSWLHAVPTPDPVAAYRFRLGSFNGPGPRADIIYQNQPEGFPQVSHVNQRRRKERLQKGRHRGVGPDGAVIYRWVETTVDGEIKREKQPLGIWKGCTGGSRRSWPGSVLRQMRAVNGVGRMMRMYDPCTR